MKSQQGHGNIISGQNNGQKLRITGRFLISRPKIRFFYS